MFKILLIIILASLILISGENFLNQSVNLEFIFADYLVSISYKLIFYAAFIVLAVIFLLFYIFHHLSLNVRRYNFQAKQKNSALTLNHITNYLSAKQLGDASQANKSLKKLDQLLKDHPLKNLLALQQENSSTKQVSKNLNKLLKSPETNIFAHQGLAALAHQDKNEQLALYHLEKAHKQAPDAVTLIKKLIELYYHNQEWHKLVNLINNSSKKKLISGADYNVERALAYLNLAEIEEDKKSKYLKLAKNYAPQEKAIQLAYAQLLFEQNKKSAFIRYFKQIWPVNQDAELFALYRSQSEDYKIAKKFKNLEKLIELKPSPELLGYYAQLTLEHKKQRKKAKYYLTKELASSSSKKLYEVAIDFFENYQESVADEEFLATLKSNINNYQD